MAGNVRIKLSSIESSKLNDVCEQIKSITKRAGVSISGPIPLPTKVIRMATRRGPSGEGRETYENWELRIHKKIINLAADERALRLIMRIQVPRSVNMEMEITE